MNQCLDNGNIALLCRSQSSTWSVVIGCSEKCIASNDSNQVLLSGCGYNSPSKIGKGKVYTLDETVNYTNGYVKVTDDIGNLTYAIVNYPANIYTGTDNHQYAIINSDNYVLCDEYDESFISQNACSSGADCSGSDMNTCKTNRVYINCKNSKRFYEWCGVKCETTDVSGLPVSTCNQQYITFNRSRPEWARTT